MKKKTNLLEGNIYKALIALALPIMGTSFIQMAYNLADMFWIGKMGSAQVAAVGTAGFFTWLSLSLIRMVQIGTEVKISQNIGAQETKKAASYAISAIWAAAIFALLYTVIMFIFDEQLIAFFKLDNQQVNEWAVSYLNIVSVGMIFSFINPVMSSIYNGSGKSTMPFYANVVGLVLNIVLDPIFIFVLGWGVNGAAWATVLAQAIVSVSLCFMLIKRKPIHGFSMKAKPILKDALAIIKLGAPVAIQSALFTIFAILIARVIASFGTEAIAAQKVGVQVEAISYMTAHGFAAAFGTFTGQNFGAGNYERVLEGAKKALGLMVGFGILTTALLYFFAAPIFSIFISDPITLEIGVVYLKILAYSQMFMCIEITLAGLFNGVGKTKPPAVMSIIFTGLRVPAAYLLSAPALLGLEGVWWAITLSSIIKGLLIIVMSVILVQTLFNNRKIEAL